MLDLTNFAKEKLKKVAKEKKLRILKNFSEKEDKLIYKKQNLISFAHNDYFGLAKHDLVKKSAIRSINQYGVGAKSSRLVCANNVIYQKLENNIARLKKTDQAVVFGSGYMAAIGVISSLLKKDDLVVADKLIHACLLDAVKLSGAKLLRFKHNDYKYCENILQQKRRKYQNCLIVSETIFSMDGDLANLEILKHLTKKYQSWLLTDDAHGLAIVKYQDNSDYIKNNYIQLGTLSKGVGSDGGYVAASSPLCDYIISQARSLIYTTALPYAVIAAANQALELLLENNQLQQKLQNNIQLFCKEMTFKSQISPIFKIIIPSIDELEIKHQKLVAKGFYVSMIRPPTSPTARLRISLSAAHTEQEIKALAQALKYI